MLFEPIKWMDLCQLRAEWDTPEDQVGPGEASGAVHGGPRPVGPAIAAVSAPAPAEPVDAVVVGHFDDVPVDLPVRMINTHTQETVESTVARMLTAIHVEQRRQSATTVRAVLVAVAASSALTMLVTMGPPRIALVGCLLLVVVCAWPDDNLLMLAVRSFQQALRERAQ